MGILVLSSFYEYINVLSVKPNTQIKKAQGGGTYAGTQLNYENMEGEVKSAKWAQSWLDNKYQKDLKDAISKLKPGSEATLYWEKTVDEDKYNSMEDGSDEKKKVGNWGVKSITGGHVEIPKAKSTDKAKTAAAKKSPNQKSDGGVGMKVGHAIKGATTLFMRLKKPFVEAAIEVHDLTAELHQEMMEKTGMEDYPAGQAAGNAVLNACFLVSPKNPDLGAIARKILFTYLPEIQKHIEAPAQEESEPEVELEAEESPDFDNDIPF